MRPLTAFTAGIAALAALGCVSLPGSAPYRTLDYVIDRPRVLAIRLNPVVLAHRRPVRVEALAVAPGGAVPTAWSLDRCQLLDDLPTRIDDVECFGEPTLSVHLADTMPASFDAPDLSETRCEDTADSGAPSQARKDPPIPDTDADTGVVLLPYSSCDSVGPIRVTATFGDTSAMGAVFAIFRREPWHRWERPPRGIATVPHGFRPVGDVAAGGVVALTYTIDSPVVDFRWYVDAGLLQATGVTTAQRIEGKTTITTNTLEIPADFHGPLRVIVVAQGAWVGDMTWDVLPLSIP